MPGYILKITIEDTHPPVWRRIVVPETITFHDLHHMIQIVFGWEDMHLHGFRIPSEDIFIDNEEEDWGSVHYAESETLIEQFILDHKWIRYTYDFGDDWRHKIVYEKTDENYNKRYASLLKYKGDNFIEDCRGSWEDGEGWNRSVFDAAMAGQRLANLVCLPREDLMDPEENFPAEDLQKIAEDFIEKMISNIKKGSKYSPKSKISESDISKRVNTWKKFAENWNCCPKSKTKKDQEYTQLTLPFIEEKDLEEPDGDALEIVKGEKTNRELLSGLNDKEARDYGKYLQLPVSSSWRKNQITDAVAEMFLEKPEYLLYVFYEDEYRELLNWTKKPLGVVYEKPKRSNMFIKALSLGLADISVGSGKGGKRARLSFAADIQQILEPLTADHCRKIYRELKKFSDKLQTLILFYGVIDFESLYQMFREIYHESMEKETFCRCLYWHARFNELIQTAYTDEGTSYAASVQLDLNAVVADMREYADDLDYQKFSAAELKKMTQDISRRNDRTDVIFSILHLDLHLPNETCGWLIENMFEHIMNGEELDLVLCDVYALTGEHQTLESLCSLWEYTSGLMLELELPMLKGRSRNQYAQEKETSPWETMCFMEEEDYEDSPDSHMCDFPWDIQEAMYNACSYVSRPDMKKLLEYQSVNEIRSEEFLFLLAEAHITGCEFETGMKLIKKLEKSSGRGRQAAEILKYRVKNGADVMDEEDTMDFFSWSEMGFEQNDVQKPFVRENPKIGRNDPCPCGSGKKYKKCCGRN